MTWHHRSTAEEGARIDVFNLLNSNLADVDGAEWQDCAICYELMGAGFIGTKDVKSDCEEDALFGHLIMSEAGEMPQERIPVKRQAVPLRR